MAEKPRILFCHCAQAQVLPEGLKAAVLRRLRAAEREFMAVPDLCRLCARHDPELARLASQGTLKIAACHPRAVQWLFASGGAPLPADATEVVNLRSGDPEALAARLLAPDLAPNLTPAGDSPAAAPVAAEPGPEPASAGAPAESDAWRSWFPVIDYDRCTHCLQCLSFCLFGVFGVDAAHRVQVAAADRCKTNCPACSRVCPEAAIIFPQHASGPINGEAVSDAAPQREAMKVDISALLGGDVYSRLRRRSDRAKSRFSKERDAGLALQERLRCLNELRESIEIPPEVLMSLPGPEEIQRRARAAAARAAAARENRAPSQE